MFLRPATQWTSRDWFLLSFLEVQCLSEGWYLERSLGSTDFNLLYTPLSLPVEMIMSFLNNLCTVVKSLYTGIKVWFPKKQIPNQGFKCKWFIWRVVSEKYQHGGRKWAKKEKEANGRWVIKSDTTGATGAQVQVETETEHLPLSYLTGAARKLGYLCTNSH